MAYQDIKRAKTAISMPSTLDVNLLGRIVTQEYQQLAQEVVLCHNSILVFFQQPIGVGLTTATITLPVAMLDANYVVCPMFDRSHGGWWVTNPSTTQFTFSWVTAINNPSLAFLVVR